MFQIGFGEVLVVLVVALWVIGPEKLPAVARVAGRWVARAKNVYQTVKNDFSEELRAYSPEDLKEPFAQSKSSDEQKPPPI